MSTFQSLSEAEMEIMEVIWELEGPATSSQLLEIFADKHWKIQTLSTFLTRLVDKGVLRAEKRGKMNLFTPAVTRQGYRELEAKHVIDSMYRGSMRDFLAAFYGGKPLKREEADQLRAWFDEVAGHEGD